MGKFDYVDAEEPCNATCLASGFRVKVVLIVLLAILAGVMHSWELVWGAVSVLVWLFFHEFVILRVIKKNK